MQPSEFDPLQRLVYGISHDMGASLRAVIRFSELLRNNLDDRLSEREQYWLELIHEGGVKAQDMVDALLVYSRLATQAESPSSIDLTQMIQDSLNQSCQKLAISPDCININFNNDSCIINDIRSHWQLLINAILCNALLYHPKESSHQPQIDISLQCEERRVCLRVSDNGIGMNDEQRENATRPFMRGVSEKEYPGLGMGLSFCERIAQLHHGELKLAASPSGGMEVTYEQEISP